LEMRSLLDGQLVLNCFVPKILLVRISNPSHKERMLSHQLRDQPTWELEELEEDGHDISAFGSSTNIYIGSSGDGYAFNKFSNSINIYKGGSADGHATLVYVNNAISIFQGGSNDGYAKADKILSFVWTGNVGDGWNVTGNWMNGVVPNINSNVIIPPGALNFPAINAGVMSIGQDPNAGNYLCRQINILSGAEMTFRLNAFLENYGDLDIRGTVFILNNDKGAVQNLNGGKINIRNGGRLEF